ncbi:MAG: AAA family ATPase [Planctomycetia bacterium]|nr:AAA family ATPase [Planctomycetia bacterium]
MRKGQPGFNQIHVKGFRRLYDVDLDLRPLTVLIGANGTGKTSLLDVFSLLAASANKRLDAAIRDFGGIDAVLTFERAREMAFELTLEDPKAWELKYDLAIAARGLGHQITVERLKGSRNANDVLNLAGSSPSSFIETNLSAFSHLFLGGDDFLNRLRGVTHYHTLQVDGRAPVRIPQPVRPATVPGANGEDLISCLYSMRETDRGRYEDVEAALRAAFPGFERLDFPPVAAGMLAMTWKDRHFSRPIFMNQLSEGMLRFLWLATLLYSPGLGGVTLIDEPEVSLHPELLSLLAALLRDATSRTQLIVATHADRLVRFLEPKEIVAMDVNDEGMVEAHWADEFDLEEWLKEYTLDEVWRKGRIGGRA